MEISVRHFEEKDIDQMWQLMHDLAVFEKYVDNFKITPEIIREKGLVKSPPDFYCLIAEDLTKKKIAGILVYYFYNYTAQNRPVIYMKELIVQEHYRNKRIGEKFMQKIAQVARDNNCFKIKWEIVPWNNDAKRFYERLGGKENSSLITYELNEEDFLKIIKD
jgi:GNAT superfamily N-acetyltransferase